LETHQPSTQAATRLSVFLVTPRGKLAARDLDEIIAPGVEGEFGLLPGHVAFISALKSGVLTLRDGARRECLAVGPGYLQVGADGQTRILVQDAKSGADVDVAEALSDKAAAEELLKSLTVGDVKPGDLTAAQARLAWALARIDAHAAAGAQGKSG
jgi:F-type H+-transporting ATPase subunit epsilon